MQLCVQSAARHVDDTPVFNHCNNAQWVSTSFDRWRSFDHMHSYFQQYLIHSSGGGVSCYFFTHQCLALVTQTHAEMYISVWE